MRTEDTGGTRPLAQGRLGPQTSEEPPPWISAALPARISDVWSPEPRWANPFGFEPVGFASFDVASLEDLREPLGAPCPGPTDYSMCAMSNQC